jgi:DNA-binding transcriptional MerR regulator
MAEVAPYVLRYWETEFSALSEGKEKGGTRLYTARDVQIIARIRQLLYDEGFTVAGAKKRLDAEILEGRFDGSGKATEAAARPAPAAAPVKATPTPAPPAAVAPPPPPVSKPTPVSVAQPVSFPERKAVIRELKEIVRFLEKPKKG